MDILLKGHPYKYELEQTAIMLLPELEPRVVSEKRDDNRCAVSVMREDERGAAVETAIFSSGVEYTSKDYAARGGLNERLWIKTKKQLVSASFYHAAIKLLDNKPEWGMLSGVRPAKIALAFFDEGCTREQTIETLMSRYDLSPAKAELCAACAEYSLAAAQRGGKHGISLYVSIPFCPTKCAYCSFVSSTGGGQKLVQPYLEVLRQEMRTAAGELAQLPCRIKTVYIGGGTPSILSADEISRLLDDIMSLFDLSALDEFTFEAGRPETIDRDKLAVIKAAGVTRICVNPQSMDDVVLKLAGRTHTAADTKRAFEDCRRAGFGCINMDMLYGLPGDDEEMFAAGVRTLVGLGPENITIHNMALKRGAAGIKLSDMRGADYALDELGGAGYKPYYIYRQKYAAHGLENTGFTLPGHACWYNIIMNEELHPVISLGAGGMSKIPGGAGLKRQHNPKYPQDYIREIDRVVGRKREFIRGLGE